MKYRNSQLDERNFRWFGKDLSRATLSSIKIATGTIRGLRKMDIQFTYPITAIAGRNGTGKSTLLAIAACGFHNNSNGFRLPTRKLPYYTFSDFFVQSADEVPLEGIHIRYGILYDKWKPTSRLPDGKGPGVQARIKRYGGRWNNYHSRVHRPVLYLGIDRVVPHAEKSVTKNYRSYFLRASREGWEKAVREAAGRVLDVDYTDFLYKRYSKYKLAVVEARGVRYSGFNMGAGEDALFELLSNALGCPEGALILIDEIELGLHEEAQARLIDELKEICRERHLQIICTTHGPRILESLPPEGRLFLERVGKTVIAIPSITAAYATGKLAGQPSGELLIYVEDELAQSIVSAILTKRQRERSEIFPIGSAAAVMRQLAARFRESPSKELLGVLDGDKRGSAKAQERVFLKALESPAEKAGEWIQQRLTFLPGDSWPERCVLDECVLSGAAKISDVFSVDETEALDSLRKARRAPKHKEFTVLAEQLRAAPELVVGVAVRQALDGWVEEKEQLRAFVERLLG